MEEFKLQSYLSNGVENIVKNILKGTVKNPKTSIFLMQFAAACKKSRRLREELEKQEKHIPPFLIASITHQCNLYCKGCYARANHSCFDEREDDRKQALSSEQWGDIFNQAQKLGINFILIAGGEPFVRRDILIEASRYNKVMFPIFTNGTIIDKEYIDLLTGHRNLVPILSIEGNEETTDNRRGEGVYQKLQNTMEILRNNEILFGASVTVHKENVWEVLSEEFITNLNKNGCKAIIYVEYVPIDENTKYLAFDDEIRETMTVKLNEIRRRHEEMLFIAFPGDEKSSGGCLAAGRGFFHINAYGGAEPCPFSPYSDTSLKYVSLEEALNSPLFKKLKESNNLLKEHIGGCVLFEQENQVKEMLKGESV